MNIKFSFVINLCFFRTSLARNLCVLPRHICAHRGSIKITSKIIQINNKVSVKFSFYMLWLLLRHFGVEVSFAFSFSKFLWPREGKRRTIECHETRSEANNLCELNGKQSDGGKEETRKMYSVARGEKFHEVLSDEIFHCQFLRTVF